MTANCVTHATFCLLLHTSVPLREINILYLVSFRSRHLGKYIIYENLIQNLFILNNWEKLKLNRKKFYFKRHKVHSSMNQCKIIFLAINCDSNKKDRAFILQWLLCDNISALFSVQNKVNIHRGYYCKNIKCFLMIEG